MPRTNKSARAAVLCPSCGRPRLLAHPEVAGSKCRSCAASSASAAARVANLTTTPEKFEKYVSRTSDCWVWTGHRYSNGYGAITHERTQVLAHRWSYEHFVGPIPDGLQIDHLCRNRACVNPEHLEPVTARENTRRAMRSHCVNGHPFSADNTYMHGGKRYCRTCRRERVRARREQGAA